MSLIGAAGIAAGASLLGGLFGKKSQDQANRQALENARLDRELQTKFAKEGIRWRVEDAKLAGLHPLYALGGTGATYTPSALQLDSRSPVGEGLAAAGQDIGRAVAATSTIRERGHEMTRLGITNAQLQNDLLRSRIAINRASLGPGFPSASPNMVDGQGNTPIIDEPQRRTGPGEKMHQEPGAITDVGFAKTSTGYAPIPSENVKERIEDQFLPETAWAIRNYGKPNIGTGSPPPKSWLLDPSNIFVWSYSSQEWQERPRRRLRPDNRLKNRKYSRKPAYGGRSFSKTRRMQRR